MASDIDCPAQLYINLSCTKNFLGGRFHIQKAEKEIKMKRNEVYGVSAPKENIEMKKNVVYGLSNSKVQSSKPDYYEDV